MNFSSFINIIMNFIRKYIPLLLVILVPFMIEKKSLYKFAKWIWVDPIAKHVSDSICISILIIAIVSYFYYESFFNKKSKIILPALLAVIIIIVRTWSYWDFRGFYWTMPFLLLFIYVISEIFPKKKNETRKRPPDELKREGFAVSILKDINSKKDIEHSYNYGLVGEWGSGKSFLMEMMYEKMQNEPKTFITYYFKPWETPNEKEFAVQIIDGIKSKTDNRELKNKVGRFLTKIESDSGDILTKTFTTLFSWLISDDSSIDDIKRDLSAYLKYNDKRLVVFLDDLDRLDASEIKELLRLMRNTFDIPYLFFIVGFDRKYLAKTLSFNEDEFDNYISKFFQVKVNVPLLNNDDLFEKYYSGRLVEILSYDPKDFEMKKSFKLLVSEQILNLISTPREFENIISSFDLSYQNLKNNCDWFTLFQLEIIKNTNYDMYDFIRLNGPSILDNIDILVKDNKITENIKPVIKLIESSSSIKGNYKFWDIKYFRKYFSLVNAAYEIDMAEFNLAIEGDINGLQFKFEEWINEDKYIDLDSKLVNYLRSGRDTIPELLVLIDKAMSIGPYSRKNIYEPVIYFLVKVYKDDKANGIRLLDEIKHLLGDVEIYRTLGYYFISDDIERVISDIGTRLSLLISQKNLNDNEVYWFVNHVYFWLNQTNLAIVDLINNDVLERNRERINHIIENKISTFARKDIEAFLTNFICQLISSNKDINSYTFYNEYIPKILSIDDAIQALNSLPMDDSIDELIRFLRSPRDTFGYYQFNFIHNRLIKD